MCSVPVCILCCLGTGNCHSHLRMHTTYSACCPLVCDGDSHKGFVSFTSFVPTLLHYRESHCVDRWWIASYLLNNGVFTCIVRVPSLVTFTNETEAAVLHAKMRSVPVFALRDCGRLWNPSGYSNSGRPEYETGILATTSSLLMFEGDGWNTVIPVYNILSVNLRRGF